MNINNNGNTPRGNSPSSYESFRMLMETIHIMIITLEKVKFTDPDRAERLEGELEKILSELLASRGLDFSGNSSNDNDEGSSPDIFNLENF